MSSVGDSTEEGSGQGQGQGHGGAGKQLGRVASEAVMRKYASSSVGTSNSKPELGNGGAAAAASAANAGAPQAGAATLGATGAYDNTNVWPPEMFRDDSDVRVALYRAFCDEDWAKVHDLLIPQREVPTPIDYVNDKHNTVLHAAVQFGAPINYVTKLLERGADANAPNDFGATPLHFAAAFRAPFQMFELLLSKGADPNRPDAFGVTPLHVAVEKGAPLRTIEVLLHYGADANYANNAGFSAMHVAAESNAQVGVVRALLNAGADINRRTKKGSTPLDVAIGHHGSSAQLTTFLQDEGAFRARDLGWCCVVQ